MHIKRVFLIVLDSFGIGALPDAARFGDAGSNTLAAVEQSPCLHIPTLEQLGLFHIAGTNSAKKCRAPLAAYARMAEASNGKDTTTGHWEIAGIVTEQPFPTYPNGFPPEIITAFEKATGRRVLCNRPYSGTAVIADYGEEHVKTGALIVYTSADSVFQIAAHEDVVPVEQLYTYCRIARKLLAGEHAVGRVIARPFAGSAPNFYRTERRHDFSLEPSRNMLLSHLSERGFEVLSVGKIFDIFSGVGITKSIPTHNNREGMEATERLLGQDFQGLCFVNLVDFDMLYGHRNDVDGYAKALSAFDSWLGAQLARLRKEDLWIITADHGCDPSTPSTDHSREYTPLLVYGDQVRPVDLGTRDSFSDIAKTIEALFAIDSDINGSSFLKDIEKDS